VNHPTTVALIVPNYAQLATMWYQKLAKPIAAPFPGVDELNDPSKSHLELFDAPEFKQLISDEVCVYVCMYVSKYLCIYECMYVCIYVCIYICMYVCMYIYRLHPHASMKVA
jgi:hypothetical protein